MRDLVRVSDVHFRLAPPEKRASGLYGHVSFVVDDVIYFPRVAVRRTRGGRWVLAFPKRYDERGVEYSYARPLTNAVRTAITAQVIAQVRRGAPAR